ncbi:hypothetical protein Tco_1022531 [Tanacetum coccineum]
MVQLKQARFEIDRLEDHKEQLQCYYMHSNLCNGAYIHLEASTQESKSIKSKIKELEKQLSMEKEECRRLGEQLGLDARAAANEDDIGIDMLSYEDNLGNLLVSPQNDKASPMKDQYKSSLSKKMTRADMVKNDEKSKLEEWRSTGNMRPERHSRGNPCIAQTQNSDKVISNTRHLANVDMVEADDKSKPCIFYIALWSHIFMKSSCCLNG